VAVLNSCIYFEKKIVMEKSEDGEERRRAEYVRRTPKSPGGE
jgi:hypothetical protein